MNDRDFAFVSSAGPLRLTAAVLFLSLTGMIAPAFAEATPSHSDVADQFEKEIAVLAVEEPSESDPVSVATAVFPAKVKVGERAVVVIKVRMKPGWHIYAYVPSSAPYIQTRQELELPGALRTAGEWSKPPAERLPFDQSVFVYEGDQVFVREIEAAASGGGEQKLSAGLFYQTCKRELCLPPTQKINQLTLTVF